MAISPTFTGCRKSMSSIAPRPTVPRATRPAAMVPAWVIHCIMRPPWICPGAPACSGNTNWTISTLVSAMDGMVTRGRIARAPNPVQSALFPEAGIEEIPQAVTEQVDGEHGQEEGKAREHGDPGGGGEKGLTVGEHGPTGDRGRLGSEPQEGQAGLGDHVAAHADGRRHQEGSERVGQEMAAHHTEVSDTEGAGSRDVVPCLEGEHRPPGDAGDGGPAQGDQHDEDLVETGP